MSKQSFLRWAPYLLGAVITAAALYLFNHNDAERPEPLLPAQVPERPAAAQLPAIPFSDITESAGIHFRHTNGARGERLLPETMGSGVAFLDYDRDGDQDLLLINASHWPSDAPPGEGTPTPALYANDGHGQFHEVTAEAGLNFTLYGVGATVGDIDNDGWPDLFITALGHNRLLHNRQGHFVDITSEAGVSGDAQAWSTAATLFDYDNDGDLDLFVANYVEWSRDIDMAVDFRLTGIGRAYGPPTAFAGSHPYLYRNDGHSRFTDVSAQSGLHILSASHSPLPKALAVLPFDVDEDGWLDLLIANDTVRNLLFHNQGDGSFKEVGIELGLAFDRNGHATGAMGLDLGDFRNDGAPGVLIGNFANEMSSLYTSPGLGLPFSDDAIIEGLGAPSRGALSFATLFLDADLDAHLDLLQVNGHIEQEINRVQASQHYAQPAQLFWNCAADCPQRFQLLPTAKVGDLARPLVGRGAAYADIDGDGDLDLALTEVGGPAHLLRNDQQSGNHWLRVELQGVTVNRDAIGARITLQAGGITQQRLVQPMRGYLSRVESAVTFGLGQSETVEQLNITWPDGTLQRVDNPAINTTLQIRQTTPPPSGNKP